MAHPPSQKIAEWAIESLSNENWIPLSEICHSALRNKLTSYSEDEISDLVESELQHIAEILRNNIANSQENGEITLYEIDNEQSPYIKKLEEFYPELLKRLCVIEPCKFEELCVKVLEVLGCEISERIGGNQDDGIDFYGFNLPLQSNLSMPKNASTFIIGQAKRYKRSHTISETEIRKFVGGALKKINDFRKSGLVSPLTPIVFAFWTSSDFDQPAKKYAQNMGIWLLNG